MISIGPLKIIYKSFWGLALHWNWSITWRWIIVIGRGNWNAKDAHKGFYWHRPNKHWMQCGLNTPLIDFGFVMQSNLRRENVL